MLSNESPARNHDQEQRQLALDPTKSFIVQAPAGSGKTELLIQRFLTLLTTVKLPEEILAITFTKKAASEMRARVIKALKNALDSAEPTSAHAKQTWQLARQVLQRDSQHGWHLIQNPNQLRIQTIDSLCSYLTKQLPLLSHFGSTPQIHENPTHLYRAAVQEVLMHVEENHEWSKAIANLLSHLDNDLNKLHDLLVTLLAKRDQWLPYIHLNSDSDQIKNELEAHLSAIITDALSHLVDIMPDEFIFDLLELARYAAHQLKSANRSSPIVNCLDLQDIPGSSATDKKYWLGIADLLLTKEGEWRKSVRVDQGFPAPSSFKNPEEKRIANDYKERITDLLNNLQDASELKSALVDLRHLPEHFYHDAQWQILQSLLSVLKILAAQLRVTFQQYGQIDFIQNAQAALEALGTQDNYTDLALALDYQIRHLLVDEFQDTSLSQYQLLEKLIVGWENADGRTLFVVGDPMQSIYRFREAEVGLFIRMRSHGIGNIKLIPLTLSVNFRSAAPIVDWNNQHFSQLFPAYNDIATGAVTYSPSTAQHTDIQHTDITVKGFVSEDKSKQASHVVELIRQTLSTYPHEKIAILVRSRPHLEYIIPALKNAGIPYCAVAIDPLASRQNIQDLLALTCALLHPADRISWLAILRAPWCGFSLADLLIISGHNGHTSLWERLDNPAVVSQLSSDGQKCAQRIIPILKSAIAERERTDLRFWIEQTWLLLGGPACLKSEADLKDTESYFALLEELYSQDQTINLDKLKEKMEKLYAAAQNKDAAVQIMTVHNAKGLEFDTVILPHLERKPAADDKSLLLWMERPLNNDQVALLLAPIQAAGVEEDKLYDYVNRQHRMKLEREIDRLLYVATTRAKKRLHLTFSVDLKDDGTPRLDAGSFLQKLWPLFECKKDAILCFDESRLIIDESSKTNRAMSRLIADWSNPITTGTKAKLAIHNKKAGFKLESNESRLIGIVTHRILQQLSLSGTMAWCDTPELIRTNYIKNLLVQAGALPEKLARGTALINQAIKNTLDDKRGKWILYPHQENKSEYKITAVIDGEAQHLIIDRTFVDENGNRWIIDYKTTTFTATDLANFHSEEQEKYKVTMQKYAKAFSLMEERPIKMGLYFPAIPSWHEWEAESY